MNETSKTIKAWGDETFGKAMDPVRLVERAEIEMAELKEALATGDMSEAGKEAADVVILLHRLMGDLGKDLAKEVDAKMAINRTREWVSAGDGTGSHSKKSTRE